MITKINTYNHSNARSVNSGVEKHTPLVPIGVKDNSFKSLYNTKGLSFKGMAVNIAIPQIITRPNSYHMKLAKALGIAAEKLSSILAPEELKEILRKAKPENFTTGISFENVLNGKFSINLHMHTQNSDGIIPVGELLEQSARYAQYRKSLGKQDPLIIAISDHDTLSGVKEAVKIIAGNSKKYKDIRLVPAIEFNTVYNSRQMETIGYCINPFDKGLNEFIDSNRRTNKEYLQGFLSEKVNKWEESAGIPKDRQTTLDTVLTQARERNVDCGRNLKDFGSPGLIAGFTNALKSLFFERHWSFDGIDKFAKEHGLRYGSFAINPGTPDLKTIAQILKDSSCGFLGIAHPCRNFEKVDLRYVFPDLKESGIEAVETNYQYPIVGRYPKSFQDHVKLAAEQSDMINTGGYDNHNDNIFSNSLGIEDLPDKAQAIIFSSEKQFPRDRELEKFSMVG